MKTKRILSVLSIVFAFFMAFGCYFALNGNTAKAEGDAEPVDYYTLDDVSLSMVDGAFLRVNDPDGKMGIRFVASMTEEHYQGLMNNVGEGRLYKNIQFGVVIIYEDYHHNANPVNEASLFGYGGTKHYDWAIYNSATGKWDYDDNSKFKKVVNIYADELKTIQLTTKSVLGIRGSLTEILDDNLARNFVGIGYVKAEKQDGTPAYLFSTETEGENVIRLAQKAYENIQDQTMKDKIQSMYLDRATNLTVDYTVEHHISNPFGDGYYLAETEEKTAKVGSVITADTVEKLTIIPGLKRETNDINVKVYAGQAIETIKVYYTAEVADIEGQPQVLKVAGSKEERTLDVAGATKVLDADGNELTVSDGKVVFDELTTGEYVYYALTEEGWQKGEYINATHVVDDAEGFTEFFNSYYESTDSSIAQPKGLYVAITNDIDFNGQSFSGKGEGMSYPNQTDGLKYYKTRLVESTINGLGHLLENLNVSGYGLFGGAEDTTIKNIAIIASCDSVALIGNAYPGTKLENVYVKATMTGGTANRGLIYTTNDVKSSTKLNNVIADVYYPISTHETKRLFGADASDSPFAVSNSYGIGNADMLCNSITERPYESFSAFYSANKANITPDNGFNSYWKVTDDGLYFGSLLINDLVAATATAYATTYSYDSESKGWVANNGTELDVASVIGENPVAVKVNNKYVAVNNGVITLSSATLGSTVSVIAETATRKIVVNAMVVSHAISTWQQMNAYLQSYGGAKDAEGNGSKNHYAVLTADIDYNGNQMNNVNPYNTDNVASNKTTSYKNFNDYYQGVFDGLGHTISNMVIPNGSGTGAAGGMFGGLNGAKLRNFAIVDCRVYGNARIIGGDVYSSTVENIYVQATREEDTTVGVFNRFYTSSCSNVIVDVKYVDGATKTSKAIVSEIYNNNTPKNTITLGNATYAYNTVEVDYATGNALAEAYFNGTVSFTGFNSYWTFEKTENSATIKFGDNVIGTYTKA